MKRLLPLSAFVLASFMLMGGSVLENSAPSYISDKGIPVWENPGSCPDASIPLQLKITHIQQSKGFIVIDLHNDNPAEFLDSYKVLRRLRVPARVQTMDICLPVPGPGDYAVAIYHDQNNNQKFDKNFLGLPSESFGMSGEPKFGLKKPKYEDCALTVGTNGAQATIKLYKTKELM